MAEEIRQHIADYLAEHRYMALATLSTDGKPMVHTVGYTSKGTTLYCATFKQSGKIHNIRRILTWPLWSTRTTTTWGA